MGTLEQSTNNDPDVVLYIEHSGIGNTVLSTPLLKAVRLLKPHCHLYVHCWNRSVRAFEGLEFIDSCFVTPPSYLTNPLRSNIDYLIVSPVGALANIVSSFVNTTKHLLRINVGPFWAKHEAEYKFDIAKQLGFIGPMPPCSFATFDCNVEKAESWLKSTGFNTFICINASFLKTGHWHLKGWDRYAELLTQLNVKYPEYNYVFIGTKEDRGDADRIINGAHIKDGKCFNLCGKSDDIKDTAAVMLQSDLVIGNDGGLQHIAAALGVPTVTIFLFTNIIKNRPLGPLSHIAANDCDKRLTCQHHIELIDVCSQNGCMSVSVDKVMEKVGMALDK